MPVGVLSVLAMPGPACRVALKHPEWVASKLIQHVHTPASPKGQPFAAAVPVPRVTAYSPRQAKTTKEFHDR
jgi:hypothetical protein